MAFIPLPQGVKLCFHFTLQGVPVAFCVFVDAGGPITQNVVNDISDDGRDWWDADGYLAFSQDLTIVKVQATDMSQQPAFQATDINFTHTTGNIAVESLPNGSAIVATLLTGFIGRSYRGRVFLPGVDVDAVVQNTLTSGAKTNILGALNALKGDLAGRGYDLAVASYQNAGVMRTTGVLTPVAGFVVRDNVKSQRRRNLPG